MFDVFYQGPKPGLFPFEKPAQDLDHAARLSRTKFFWFIDGNNDYSEFDFDQRPVPWQSEFVHVWPSQWQTNGGTYLANKHTVKNRHWHFRDDAIVPRQESSENWHIPEHINSDTVDYTWHPNPLDPPYVYHFPSQHQSSGGVTYTVPGATEIKLSDAFVVKSLPRTDNWYVPEHINSDTVDYTWHPNPLDPPYVYHFPVKWGWQNVGGVEFRVPDATEHKYIDIIIAETRGNKDYWYIPDNIDPDSIDYSWCPDPTDPPLIYQFPVKWGWDRIGGPEYRVPGATDIKFLEDFQAKTLSNMDNWVVPVNVDRTSFDFSWAPHPAEEPYIYKFPTVWNAVGGPEYHTPGATQEKYLDVLVAKTLPDPMHWSVPEEVNANQVDFSWVPHPQDPPYIYHFGTEFQQTVGLTYTVPGATEIKFAGPIPTPQQQDRPVLEVLDIFFIDKNNASAMTRYERLQERYPDIHRVRYANSIMDTITRCLARSKTNKFWVISSENIYDDFDFTWHAQPWQRYMTHVFGSQWQKWSDTFLINRYEFERHTQWAGSIEQFPNLNFVKDQSVMIPDDLHDIYWVSHGNTTDQYQQLCQRYPDVKSTRFVDSYLKTLRRILTTATTEYVWVVSSLCDYARFDFSWQPEPWQRDMLHVFPTAEQKFGDTFYVPVNALRDKIDELELLDWFETVNYCEDQRVVRWPMPVFEHAADSHVDAVLQSNYAEPLALFTNHIVDLSKLPTVSLWRDKTRTIVPLDAGAGVVIVPKSAIPYIKTQLYDYPYIDKTQRQTFTASLQDVVFISYDEPDAEANWAILKAQCPRAQRVHGVAGMELALETAADLSSTPWYYAVFAKTKLHERFDFSFVPDYMQQPKHYIFNCHNTTNGLEYGHMGVVLYNCNGVKQTNQINDFGLDYTMSFPHESIPILSCYGDFATTPYHTWRTAFRETAKLAYFESQAPTVEGAYRLNRWLNQAQGNHAEWCLHGARDGHEFFKTTQGDLTKLKQSFRWEWLRSYFEQRYGELK